MRQITVAATQFASSWDLPANADRAEACGLPLPPRWRARFPCDPTAPMAGTLRGAGKLFLLRRRRSIGQDRSEHIHPSVAVPVARDWSALLRRRPG